MTARPFADKVNEWSPVLTLLAVIVAAITVIVMVQGNIGGRLDNIDARFDALNVRLDAMQAESNRRFDAMQAESNRRFDAMQADSNRRFDAAQAEENRRHEELLKVLQSFEGRISHLEGRLGSE